MYIFTIASKSWRNPGFQALSLSAAFAATFISVMSTFIPATASARSIVTKFSLTLARSTEDVRFDGIGAVSAGASSRWLYDYPEPVRSRILDLLFKPNFGAALQHLKVEIGADVNSTDGSEPSHARSATDRDYTRGYEWWLMKEAVRRNPRIELDVLPWGAPAWVGTFYSPAMADYVADFIEAAKRVHGLDIAYVGIWNEMRPDAAYVKLLRKTLDARKLRTRIICCDQYPFLATDQWEILPKLASDPELDRAIYALSVHYPEIKGVYTTPPAARLGSKPLWASEDQPLHDAARITPRDWPRGGQALARLYNENYLRGGFTNTQIWSPVTSYANALPAPGSGLMRADTPWSGHYRVDATLWVTAHTTQFTQPGWRILRNGSRMLPGGGSVVSYAAPNGGDWSLVAETINARQPVDLEIEVAAGLARKSAQLWRTDATGSFVHVGALFAKDGRYRMQVAPGTLITLSSRTGQARGNAGAIPPEAAFPANYSEQFDGRPRDRSPPYFADQNGAFEVRPCVGRAGLCLEQVIAREPIAWLTTNPDPYTFIGDAAATDYTVTVDVRPASSAPARLFGRIDTMDRGTHKGSTLPSGYMLELDAQGHWKLIDASYDYAPVTLGAGEAAVTGWATLSLSFRGDMVSARVDGREVFAARSPGHERGYVAVGSTWGGMVQFDNVRLKPSNKW